jgi:hypothetical protein
MKKVILLPLIAIFIFACSSEDLTDTSTTVLPESTPDLMQLLNEKYDGEILNFEDNKDFIVFYDLLSNASAEEFAIFLNVKGENNSSFYNVESGNEEEVNTNDEDGFKIFDGDFMISQFLSTIFNNQDQIIIAGQNILLDELGNLLDLKSNEIIGSVIKRSSNNNENDDLSLNRYNVNYSKHWSNSYNGRKISLSIWNETIYLNNVPTISKVFYRLFQQRESCSFWRCKWVDGARDATFSYNFNMTGFGHSPITAIVSNQNIWNQVSVEAQLASWTSNVGPGPIIAPPLSEFKLTGLLIYRSPGIDSDFYNLEYSFDPR